MFRFVTFVMGAITRRLAARSKGALTRSCWGDESLFFPPLLVLLCANMHQKGRSDAFAGWLADWEHREAFLASQQLSLMRRESDLVALRCSPPARSSLAQAAITKTRGRRKYAATRNRFSLGVHAP